MMTLRLKQTSTVMLVLLCLAGCGASEEGGSDVAVGGVHPNGWSFGHRDAANKDPVSCGVCHVEERRGGRGENQCLDCHVFDPNVFPSGCVSCHCETPVIPYEACWECDRGGEPDPAFIKDAMSSHTQHDAIPCSDRDSAEDCRVCHTNTISDPSCPGRELTTNVNRHHLNVGEEIPENSVSPCLDDGTCNVGDPYDCLSCHELEFNSETGMFEFAEFRDCAACHEEPFCSTGSSPTTTRRSQWDVDIEYLELLECSQESMYLACLEQLQHGGYSRGDLDFRECLGCLLSYTVRPGEANDAE